MEKPLEAEFRWYLDHQDELVEKHNGKFVVIKNQTVLGVYSTEMEAVQGALKEGHTVGTFLIQRCEPGSEHYTQRFHSRVIFS